MSLLVKGALGYQWYHVASGWYTQQRRGMVMGCTIQCGELDLLTPEENEAQNLTRWGEEECGVPRALVLTSGFK